MQQEARKSRFSLNFLRASLLSPKGGSASSKSGMFNTTDNRASAQSAAVNPPPPHSASNSPSRRTSAGGSAASAQHWSPLGHGASAFSGSQAALDDRPKALSPSTAEDTDKVTGQHDARSPLRALSSNSPTRLRSANSGSLSDAISSKRRPSSLDASTPRLRNSQVISHPGDANSDSCAPTLVLSSSASAQHSPLPANALVAYSSDEDDWHNAVDATESKF